MEYAIGATLAFMVAALAFMVGFDRDRAFYSTVLIVVASYYVLFAVIGASSETLVAESVVASVFCVPAVLGFKGGWWWVAAGMAGHGVFDLAHSLLIQNSGVPRWWPGFCLAFDVIFGGCIALRFLKAS